MKLVFYSGGHDHENEELDELMLELLEKESPKVAYIPSCSYDSEVYFSEFVDQYQKFGIRKFLHFPVDVPFDEIMLREVLDSDMIHLAGGNTYYFLNSLRKSGMLPKLKSFVKRGGLLTGLSAGAIIMTPEISTAGFPEFDRDDNDDNIQNLKGLNLVDFEFFPHYRNSKRYDLELIEHSKLISRPIYACADGAGVIVDREGVHVFGKSYIFEDGKKISLQTGRVLKS